MDINMKQTAFPAEFEEIKCVQCNLFLSIPPITQAENGRDYICGRCLPNPPERAIRATHYERFAENHTFPCIFYSAGCFEQLPWNQVKEHETACTYKPIACPTPLNTCKWKGTTMELRSHFLHAHKSFILQESTFFALYIKQDTNRIKLVTMGEHVFVLQMVSDAQHYWKL